MMPDIGIFFKLFEGNIPIIISVPHGGKIKPEGIPQRQDGFHGIDKHTIDIGLKLNRTISETLLEKYRIKGSPSYLISFIHRSKVDLNRSPLKAYDHSSSLGRNIYHYFHNTLKNLILNNINKYNYSLLIDIHGYEIADIPTGYRMVDVVLGTNNLKSLFKQSIPKKNWDKNLRGKLVKALLNLDFSIAPGRPRRKEFVLTGGFITKNYGTSKLNNSQAIQLELSDKIRENKNLSNLIIETISEVLVDDIISRLK